MNGPEELSISEIRRRRQPGGSEAGSAQGQLPGQPGRVIEVSERPPPGQVQTESVQPIKESDRYRRALKRHWVWPGVLATLFGLGGLAAGYYSSRFTASVTLVQQEAATIFDKGSQGDAFKPRQFSSATMIQLIVSPELARRVAALTSPSGSAGEWLASVSVRKVPDSELVSLRMADSSPAELVDRLNLYANEAVAFTREMQREDSSRLNEFLQGKLQETDAALSKLRSDLEASQSGELTANPETQTNAVLVQLGQVMTRLENARVEAQLLKLQLADVQRGDLARQTEALDRLKTARDRLNVLLTRYKEAHPEVVALKSEIAELERQVNEAGSSSAGGGESTLAKVQRVELKTRATAVSTEIKQQEALRDSLQQRLTGLTHQDTGFQLLKARQDALLQSRQLLDERQRAAQLYEENAAGYYRVLAPATLADVSSRPRYVAASWGTAAGLILGLVLGVAAVCLVEARAKWLRTADDLRRVTCLPLLASLGDLNQKTDEEEDGWAFRTWTLINGKLNRTPDRGLVCGFISARDGEGKSTWIDLLARAASRRGLRVLKITARSSPDKSEDAAKSGRSDSQSVSSEAVKPGPNPDPTDSRQPSPAAPLNALMRPADIALQLANPKAAAVDVCLPDWVWNLDHRRQWQAALERWKAVENVVILVELPAASSSEALLLAENVPQLIWLAGSGLASERETRLHLATLKHAHCQIVGTVLNRDPDRHQNL